jgi:hypothetical protein
MTRVCAPSDQMRVNSWGITPTNDEDSCPRSSARGRQPGRAPPPIGQDRPTQNRSPFPIAAFHHDGTIPSPRIQYLEPSMSSINTPQSVSLRDLSCAMPA